MQDMEECTAVLTRARSWQEAIRSARDQEQSFIEFLNFELSSLLPILHLLWPRSSYDFLKYFLYIYSH